MLVGVISDTHGFYDPRVTPLLDGVEHILHAGDVGSPDVVRRLAEIAPVTVVRGNNDRDGECALYPDAEWLELAGCRVRLTHIVKVPAEGSAGLDDYLSSDVVVYRISETPGPGLVLQPQPHRWGCISGTPGNPVLFFNPGAAGKRRFKVVTSFRHVL